MIRTATQLKAKVRNLSGGDSKKAQTLIRNFIMERFLERIALSQYRNNFILKGGMLVAAVVGLDTRATMDIDTTVKSLNLTKDNAVKIVEEIIAVNLDDGVQFQSPRSRISWKSMIIRESGLCWKPRSIKCGRRSRWISPPGMSLLQEQSNIPIT